MSACWAGWDRPARSAPADAADAVAAGVVGSESCTAMSVADCCPVPWGWARSADTTVTCRTRGSDSNLRSCKKRSGLRGGIRLR